jgi:hypothetical protein
MIGRFGASAARRCGNFSKLEKNPKT